MDIEQSQLLFNWLDILIISSLVFFVVASLFLGFVKVLMSVMTWGVALFLAYHFREEAAGLFSTVGTPLLRTVIGCFVIFLGVMILGGIISYLVGSVVKLIGLKWVDRFAGAVLGLLLWIFTTASSVMLVTPTTLAKEPWWQASVIVPYFDGLANQLQTMIPEDASKMLNELLV